MTDIDLEQKIKERVFIAAEIGKNFIRTEDVRPVSEYLGVAKALVSAARAAGADAVKFQIHDAGDEILPISFDSPHFKGQDRRAWVKRNADATPADEFWIPLKAHCDEIGVVFFATPMSRGAAMTLERVGVPFWKVASSDILDFVMLDFMASTGKMIMVPTGMSTVQDIDRAVAFLKKKGARFLLMHAISRYPYPAEDSRLATIGFLAHRYPGVAVGFSQNSPWVEPAVVAVALGACAVEQHFTFDRKDWGPDHKVSMIPDEFTQMAKRIRAVERDPEIRRALLADPATARYMGDEEKILQEGEAAFRPIFRKSLAAGRDIAAGDVLAPGDIFAMRPQAVGGMPSEEYERVLGKTAACPLKKYDLISEDCLAG